MNLLIKVIPNSSRTEIVEEGENFLKIKLKTAPQKGKANAELIKFLAKKFGVARSKIEIVRGLTSKKKLVRIFS